MRHIERVILLVENKPQRTDEREYSIESLIDAIGNGNKQNPLDSMCTAAKVASSQMIWRRESDEEREEGRG